MNRIEKLFTDRKENILSIYFTAGHPTLDSTTTIIEILANEGVDMVEIGIPFSDPVADGPAIQHSSHQALVNGMNLRLLFNQLRDIRKRISIPLLLMGYLNPVLQYGMDNFVKDCSRIGIDGTILPDLPLEIFLDEYKTVYNRYGLYNVFLATPQTSDSRYRLLDQESSGFLYMVSASATTGAKKGFEDYQQKYFERIRDLNLKLPRLIGFGISSNKTFVHACKYANGTIIGSAFVKLLEEEGEMRTNIRQFIRSIRGN
jgi:tryptophan synthase alpha chain